VEHLLKSKDYHLTHNNLNLHFARIKHQGELVGKSTATHARILAPDDVTIHNYPVSLFAFILVGFSLLALLSVSLVSTVKCRYCTMLMLNFSFILCRIF